MEFLFSCPTLYLTGERCLPSKGFNQQILTYKQHMKSMETKYGDLLEKSWSLIKITASYNIPS